MTISMTSSNYLTLSFFFILLLKTGRGELNTTIPTLFFVKCRGPKSLDFPDGKIQRAKTFRTKCVNRFCDK